MPEGKLEEILQALSEPGSSEENILMAAAGLRELFRVDLCSVYLFDEEVATTVNVVQQGRTGGAVFHTVQVKEGPSKGTNLSGLVRKIHETNNQHGSGGTDQSICVPLQTKGQTIGVVELAGIDPSSRKDLRLYLGFIAPLFASAILSGRQLRSQIIQNADLEARCWEIRRERSKLSTVFNSLPFPFYCIDRDFRLVAMNRCTAQRGNSETHRLLGMRCYEALYNYDEPCPGCKAAESLTSGITTFRHGRKWREDGEPREWEITTYPLRDDHGRIVEAVILEQDITEKNRYVESLARTAKLAAVEQLAAGVAHEINNPLVAIIANSQLLQRELEPDDNHFESIDLIARAGDRALGVVRALLDFAQQDAFSFTQTDVNETVRSAVHLVKHQLVDSGIELSLFLSPDLPLIQASRDHLQGMWLNFIFNARDALSEGRGRITISSEQQGNYLLVKVQDDGVGISEERITRIFEPFYTTKDPGSGTGLGLSVCHRIVRQHGGKIQVQSEPQRGTEFVVSLPIIM